MGSEYFSERYSERERRRLLRRFLSEQAQEVAQDRAVKPEVRMLAQKALEILHLKEALELQAEQERPLERTSERPRVQIVQIADEETYLAGGDRPRRIATGDASGGATRRPLKRVGIFWFRESVAERKIEYSEGEFSLREGDPYIEIHVAALEPGEGTLLAARQSLVALADHIREEGLEPKYVLGVAITPEGQRIAGASLRMGFSLVRLAMPPEISSAIWEVNRISGREGLGDHVDQPILVFQTGEDFVRRFSTPSAPDVSK